MTNVLHRILMGGLLIGTPAGLNAGGLASPFVDVQLTNVPVGKEYTVTTSAGDGLHVSNLGSEPVTIQVTALAPTRDQLRGGARAIPDTAWIAITPSTFQLGPHEKKQCRMVIRVPDAKAHKKKYYQVMIWTRSNPDTSGSVTFGAGLLSRLRFKTQ